jgi:hypothetical protein
MPVSDTVNIYSIYIAIQSLFQLLLCEAILLRSFTTKENCVARVLNQIRFLI